MNTRLLERLRAKASTPDLRDLLDTLLQRAGDFDRLQQTNLTLIMQNRARREGITVEQIKRQAERGAAPFALTPDEREAFDRSEQDSVAAALDDQALFRHAWLNVAFLWKQAHTSLNIMRGHESLPFAQAELAHLDHTLHLLRTFAQARQWPVTEPEAPLPHSTIPRTKVAALRKRAAQNLLLPAGFILANNSTYVRRQDRQIHLIDFQTNSRDRSFTINLGFHYDFLPPHSEPRPIPLTTIRQTHCFLRARIGFFLPEKKDTWFHPGDDAIALQTTFENLARQSLSIFDRFAQRWQNPTALLDDCAAGLHRPWHIESEQARAALQSFTRSELPADVPPTRWFT